VARIDDEIDRLFGLPLDEFTNARNELARQLKRDGDADGAAAVEGIPKPTVAAWTVNQLARLDRAGVGALLEAGEALRTAQRRLLAGEDAAAELRDATAQERDAIRRLTERAEALLQEARRPASQAMLERTAATLRAAAVDDEGRRLLEAGRLTTELDPAGFGGLAGVPAAAGRRSRPQKPPAVDKRREREEEQRRRKELRQQARELERAARAAEREAEKLAAAADKARRRAEEARAEADAASAGASS
jgi:hypothetical protein